MHQCLRYACDLGTSYCKSRFYRHVQYHKINSYVYSVDADLPGDTDSQNTVWNGRDFPDVKYPFPLSKNDEEPLHVHTRDKRQTAPRGIFTLLLHGILQLQFMWIITGLEHNSQAPDQPQITTSVRANVAKMDTLGYATGYNARVLQQWRRNRSRRSGFGRCTFRPQIVIFVTYIVMP